MSAPAITPQAAPDPATTAWVPLGPAAPQLPPAVNGQWIKGVGGVPVWSAIAQSDLPVNMQAQESYASNDANACTATGWYRLDSGAANSPSSSQYYHLQVYNMYGNQIRQIAYQIGYDTQWARRNDTGTWQPWVLWTDSGWTAAVLQFTSGGWWSNYPTTYAVSRFRKVSGIVYIEGLIQHPATPSSGDIPFSVGPGYRPSAALLLTGACSGGVSRWDIGAGGGVSYTGPVSGTTPNAGWFSVHFSYPADQ